jgi:hypothetical protein
MPDYKAPLRDIRFVRDELLGNKMKKGMKNIMSNAIDKLF